MRHTTRLLLLTLIVLGLLVACNGQPDDTDDGSTAGGDDSFPLLNDPDAPTTTPVPTPTPIGTEDPDEGLIFDELTLVRSGGINDSRHTVTVLGNGALLINGVLAGGVDGQTVGNLDMTLDTIGFFRLDSLYGPIEPGSDTFSYEITVSRNGSSTSTRTHDGFEPESLEGLINTLLALEPVAPAPAATVDPDTIDSPSP